MNSVRIKSEVHQALRLEAFNRHTSLQGLIDEVLQQHIDQTGA